jgi:hypothetical protein
MGFNAFRGRPQALKTTRFYNPVLCRMSSECHLAKVDVEGSNPFSRSSKAQLSLGFVLFQGMPLAEGGFA